MGPEEAGDRPDLPIRKITVNPRLLALIVEFMGIGLLIGGVLWLARDHLFRRLLWALDLSPVLFLLLTTASLLGAAGSIVLFHLGQQGSAAVFERYPNLRGERWHRALGYFERWGSPLAVLCGVPGLGTILPPAAGAFGIRRFNFFFWAFLGKLIRNYLLLVVFNQGYQLLYQ